MKIDLSLYKQNVLNLPYDPSGNPWSLEYFRKYGCVLSSIAKSFSCNINSLINDLRKFKLINPNMSISARSVIDFMIDRGFVKKGKIFKIFSDLSPTGYHYISVDEEKKIIFTTFMMKDGIYEYEEK